MPFWGNFKARFARFLLFFGLLTLLIASCSEESHKKFYEDKPEEDPKNVTRLRADIVQNIRVFEQFNIPSDVRLTEIKPYQDTYKENVQNIDAKLNQNYLEESLRENYEHAKLVMTETEGRLFLDHKERLDLFLTSESVSSYNIETYDRISTDNPFIVNLVTVTDDEKAEIKPLQDSFEAFVFAVGLEELLVSLNVINDAEISSRNAAKMLRIVPSIGKFQSEEKKVQAFLEKDLEPGFEKSLTEIWRSYKKRYGVLHEIDLKYKREYYIDQLIERLEMFSTQDFAASYTVDPTSNVISTENVGLHHSAVTNFHRDWNDLVDDIDMILKYGYKKKDLKASYSKAVKAASQKHYHHAAELCETLERVLEDWTFKTLDPVSIGLLQESFLVLDEKVQVPKNRKGKRQLKKAKQHLKESELYHLAWRIRQSSEAMDTYLKDKSTQDLESYPFFVSVRDAERILATYSDMSRSNTYKKMVLEELKQYRGKYKGLLDLLH